MKIFVTVGTTIFDNLIKATELQLASDHELTFQIAEGTYIPKSNNYFRFTDKIETYYQNSDLIICHGGAGTIFRALELNKKLVIVPNLDRLDNHQLDICDYMDKYQHALACLDLNILSVQVTKAETFKFKSYKPDEFTGVEYIREYFGLNWPDSQ